MKTLSIIFYIVGAILLTISCFTPDATMMWWFGGASVVSFIVGCVCQYYVTKDDYIPTHKH